MTRMLLSFLIAGALAWAAVNYITAVHVRRQAGERVQTSEMLK